MTNIYYRTAFFWLAWIAIFWILLQLPLLGIHLHSTLTYGKLKPALVNLLVYGCLSLLFQASCLQISHLRGKNSKQDMWLRIVLLLSYVLATVTVGMGTLAILANMSSGRELGEYPFLFDQTWILSQLLFLLAIWVLGKSMRTQVLYHLLTGILVLQITYYLFGNLGWPYRLNLMAAAPFFTGYADVSTNEIYRNGILLFYVILPLLIQLGHWLPHYAAQSKFATLRRNNSDDQHKNEKTLQHYDVFQDKSFRVFILLAVLLPPLAQIGILYTPLPISLQIVNVIGYLLLQSDILMGAILIRFLVREQSQIFSQEILGILFRFGIIVLIIRCLLRIVMSLPWLTKYLAYSAFSNTYIFPDLFSYGLLLFLALAMYGRQSLDDGHEYTHGQPLAAGAKTPVLLERSSRLLVFAGVTFMVTMIISAVATTLETVLEAVLINRWETPAQLSIPAWKDIYFAAAIKISGGVSAGVQTLVSTKGIKILCVFFAATSILALSIGELLRRSPASAAPTPTSPQ